MSSKVSHEVYKSLALTPLAILPSFIILSLEMHAIKFMKNNSMASLHQEYFNCLTDMQSDEVVYSMVLVNSRNHKN
jgi:hypothetical protein